jgi:hypothetical protein
MDILGILQTIARTHKILLGDAMDWVEDHQDDYDDENALIEAFNEAHLALRY